jgi:predicted O-methyltransferase YrrM
MIEELNLVNITTELADPERIEALESYQRQHVPAFLELLEEHPLQRHTPAYVSLSEAFWLWSLCRDLAPQLAIESGCADGYSAWWLWKALPKGQECHLMTYDPAPGVPAAAPTPLNRSRWAHFHHDVSCDLATDPDASSKNRKPLTLVFYDDHQDQRARLLLAAEAGIEHVVFHDVGPDSPLRTDGLGLWGRVHEFLPIRAPEVFRLPRHSGGRWLTYVRLEPRR